MMLRLQFNNRVALSSCNRRASSFGLQEKFYSVSINGGVIADLTLEMPHAILQNDAEPQEHIAIRYRDITWTHHVAGTRGYSTWENDE